MVVVIEVLVIGGGGRNRRGGQTGFDEHSIAGHRLALDFEESFVLFDEIAIRVGTGCMVTAGGAIEIGRVYLGWKKFGGLVMRLGLKVLTNKIVFLDAKRGYVYCANSGLLDLIRWRHLGNLEWKHNLSSRQVYYIHWAYQ